MTRVTVPAVESPAVSVVMLTYGGGEWVPRALEALVESTPPVYELIVVDNASPDGTGEWLEANLEGALLVRNGANVGFGPGVNQAALLAGGRHLCLLNSDALVEPGWLGWMVAALEGVPGCGAVVPRLLNLDGTLQEAGAVIGREGWTMSLGYGDDPERPWYRFPRRVPYGSGACLCLRRSTFLSLGGFDPLYGAAYYEDVDLCLRLAEVGLGVVYEPRAVVRHVRGASSPAGKVARLRDENAQRLRSRWAEVLHDLPSLADLPVHPYRAAAARDTDAPDRVLLVGSRLPGGPAGRAGALALGLVGVAGRARVTVIGLDDPEPQEDASWLLDAGVEVIWGVTDWDDWMRRHLCHFSAAVVLGGGDGGFLGRAARLLDRYQPQAAVVLDGESAPGALGLFGGRAAGVHVWCRDEGDAASAAGAAADPGVEVAVAPGAVEGRGWREEMAAAVGRLGITPTGPACWPVAQAWASGGTAGGEG